MKKIFQIVLVSVIGIYLMGCSKMSSDDIRTSGIYCQITGTSSGDGTTSVKTKLFAGGSTGTIVELSNGDSLQVTSSGETRTQSKKEDLILGPHYKATFNLDDDLTEFTVSLIRDKGISATNSIFKLPKAFNITEPTQGQTFNKSDTVTLKWTKTDESDTNMAILTENTCEGSRIVNYTKDDSGQTSLALSEIISEECNSKSSVKITVQRVKKGIIDPNFDSGTAKGIQERIVSIAVN